MERSAINKEELIDRMADNLPTLRTKLHLTQEALASIIGVSRHTVIHIEKGKRRMTWNTFLSIFLVMYGNGETRELMQTMKICTDELKEYLFREAR